MVILKTLNIVYVSLRNTEEQKKISYTTQDNHF